MKPSHFQTPRSLNESTFWLGGEAIDRPEQRRSVGVVGWIGWVLLVALGLTLIAGR